MALRVALVGPYPEDPKRPYGGVETAFAALLDGLRTIADLDLHVLTFARGAGATGRESVDGVSVVRLPGRVHLNQATCFASDRRALRRALSELRPDVVHAQEALGYGYAALKTAGSAPVVVSIHGLVREARRHGASTVQRLRMIPAVRVERFCVHHARFLLQPTRYPEEYFGSEIGGEIFDVGNPIADAFFEASARPEPGRVLFSGSILPLKRVIDLVEAVAGVRANAPLVKLIVAGDMPDPDYAARVRRRIAELALEQTVELRGRLSREELLGEYERACMVVLPSAQETSPMAIGEAMAVGVPVVATDVGGVRQLLVDGASGLLFRPGDVEALTRHISTLLNDAELRSSLASRARDEARSRFRSAAVAGRVRDVYLHALETHATARP
jgi:glycosyltransferase involved in cell wall biosynthesis